MTETHIVVISSRAPRKKIEFPFTLFCCCLLSHSVTDALGWRSESTKLVDLEEPTKSTGYQQSLLQFLPGRLPEETRFSSLHKNMEARARAMRFKVE